ncbi:MAG: metallophosphoesterase family protein [Kiloniellaceae bacterium]
MSVTVRLAVMSDLHLEFAPYDPVFESDVDLVVLAGDIHRPGVMAVEWAANLGVPSVLVMGNHEAYGSDLAAERQRMRDAASDTACTMLENEAHVFRKGDRQLRVLGATLWTDFALLGNGPRDLITAKEMGKKQLNDFRMIRKDDRRLSPEDTITMHEESLDFLRRTLTEPFEGDTLIVTHHAPTPYSSPQQYIGGELSPCFASNLDDFVAASGANLWVHGHTHSNADMTLGRTRLVTRQRGYPGEPTFAAFEPLIVDI